MTIPQAVCFGRFPWAPRSSPDLPAVARAA